MSDVIEDLRRQLSELCKMTETNRSRPAIGEANATPGLPDGNATASSVPQTLNNGDGFDEDNKEEYVVEKICGKKIKDGVPYYHIKWVGWDASTNTWEPVHHLQGCQALLAKFEKDLKLTAKKVAKSKRGADGQPIRHGYYLKWPAEKTPLSVEGAIKIHNTPCYLVKFKTGIPALDSDKDKVDKYNSILVTSDAVRSVCPDLVIQYYERNIEWDEDSDEDIIVQPQPQQQAQYPREENSG